MEEIKKASKPGSCPNCGSMRVVHNRLALDAPSGVYGCNICSWQMDVETGKQTVVENGQETDFENAVLNGLEVEDGKENHD